MASFAWDHSYEGSRFGITTWEPSFDKFLRIARSIIFMGTFNWDLWLGISGLGTSVCSLWLVIFVLGSWARDLWRWIFGFGSVALNLGLGISGFDLWFWIFGLGSLVGKWDPEAGGAARPELSQPGWVTATQRLKKLGQKPLGKPT